MVRDRSFVSYRAVMGPTSGRLIERRPERVRILGYEIVDQDQEESTPSAHFFTEDGRHTSGTA
jgi:hypothetical protein